MTPGGAYHVSPCITAQTSTAQGTRSPDGTCMHASLRTSTTLLAFFFTVISAVLVYRPRQPGKKLGCLAEKKNWTESYFKIRCYPALLTTNISACVAEQVKAQEPRKAERGKRNCNLAALNTLKWNASQDVLTMSLSSYRSRQT
jgi:hypothetical protein